MKLDEIASMGGTVSGGIATSISPPYSKPKKQYSLENLEEDLREDEDDTLQDFSKPPKSADDTDWDEDDSDYDLDNLEEDLDDRQMSLDLEDYKDNTGKRCDTCGAGNYRETGFHDDMDGVLHCTNCGTRVDRRERIL